MEESFPQGYERQPAGAPQKAAVPRDFDTHLTADSAGALWAHYMNATLADCMLQYFLAKAED